MRRSGGSSVSSRSGRLGANDLKVHGTQVQLYVWRHGVQIQGQHQISAATLESAWIARSRHKSNFFFPSQKPRHVCLLM